MKRVGIDFRALQIGHQFRGIGEVVRRVSYELAQLLNEDDEIVVFQYEDNREVAKGVLDEYETVILPHPPQGKLAKISDSALSPAQEKIIRKHCDVFIQFDFELGVPRHHKNVVVIHDQIPYILGNKYPHSYLADYSVSRKVGLRRRDAFKKHLKRKKYSQRLATVLERAGAVITVSNYTAETTKKFATNGNLEPIVMHLGHDAKGTGKIDPLEVALNAELGLGNGNFLFFIGGVDERRRIDELVAAFNQLRAHGHDLHLVLAGNDFQTLDTIFSPSARQAIERSSYREDIHLMGFVSDGQRAWLYKNALAFVFPTEFEGFGIPVIESLEVGCPVITYNNSSLKELTGPNVYLADDWYGIFEQASTILAQSDKERAAIAKQGKKWANQFAWKNSAKVMKQAIDQL